MPEPNKADKNLLGLGMQIVAQVVVGILIGMWLDRHFHGTHSLYTLVFAVAAIVLSLYQFIRQAFKN